MAVPIKVVPGVTNRIDFRKVQRLVRDEKQAQQPKDGEYSKEDDQLLPKGLAGIVEKYSKLGKKPRASRDEYDLDDDFIDDSEAVDLGEEESFLDELEQEFYICSEELEEPSKEERSEGASAKEESDSLQDSFSEQSQIPSFHYTYEELCENLQPIPEDVKGCLLTLKDALLSNNLSRRSFTSTYVAPHIKRLFVTAAQHGLAREANFGDTGSVRCVLTEELWSHIKALFNCRGLTKYRCSKKNFEEEAFSVFYNEWKQMMRNEREKIVSDLKHELSVSTDSQSKEPPLNDTGEWKSQTQDSQNDVNSYPTDSVQSQTEGVERAEEDASASPARRCKRKAATMAAEEISNLAVHGSIQSPFKKRKLRVEWSKSLDKLVYDYFVKKIAQIRCRDLGKSKKNENAESATELLNAAFSEYEVTEKDLIDSYRRHKAEVKRSQRQKSEEKREEIRLKKQLAAQRKMEREQSFAKIQKGERPKIHKDNVSKEQIHTDGTKQPETTDLDTVQMKLSKSSAVSSEEHKKVKNTSLYAKDTNAIGMVDDGLKSNTNNEVAGETLCPSKVKTHSAKRKLNSTKPTSSLVRKADNTSSAHEYGQKKSDSFDDSNRDRTPTKQEAEINHETTARSKSKPKRSRLKNSSVGLNEKILKQLPSINERPKVTQVRIPAGFAAEVEAALE